MGLQITQNNDVCHYNHVVITLYIYNVVNFLENILSKIFRKRIAQGMCSLYFEEGLCVLLFYLLNLCNAHVITTTCVNPFSAGTVFNSDV